MAEIADPFAEAKRRLTDAETRGFDALAADNENWFKEMFARREVGRIFTGNFASALKDIILPFFYMGSWQDPHCQYGNPDPARYEGDAGYNTIEAESPMWSGLQCFNEEFFTGFFVAGLDEGCVYYTKLVNFWRSAWEKHAKDKGYEGMFYMRGYVPPIKNDVYYSWDPAAMSGCDWNSMGFSYKMVWNAFDYGGRDDAYLKEKVYPGLRNLADFFCSLVKKGDDGYYHIEKSMLRENLAGRDAQDCIATAKWCWKTAILAANILKSDAAKRQRWQQHLDQIAPYYLMPDGTYGAAVVHKSLNNWAKAGVMIRETLDPGSRHALACVTPQNGINFHHRAAVGGKTENTAGSKSPAPCWLRLVRTGAKFTAYESADGSQWTQFGSQTIEMAETVYVGLAVCSHGAGYPCTVRFSNVELKSASLTGKDIGQVGCKSEWTEAGGTHTIQASGNDIFGAADSFYFACAQMKGDGQVTARVAAIEAEEKDVVQQMKVFQHFPIDVTDEFNLDLSPAERQRALNSCEGFPGDVEHLLGKNPDRWTGPGFYLPHPWLLHYARKQDESFGKPMEARHAAEEGCRLLVRARAAVQFPQRHDLPVSMRAEQVRRGLPGHAGPGRVPGQR